MHLFRAMTILAAALFSLPLVAQQAETPAATEAAPQQKTASVSATLYRVDGGMFDIRMGDAMDLTDRKILLVFPQKELFTRQSGEQEVSFRINGHDRAGLAIGDRYDLKRLDETENLLKDKKVCYLEVIKILTPKGAPVTATLRFECD